MKFLGLFIFLCGVAVGSVFGLLPTLAMIIAGMLCSKAYSLFKKSRAEKSKGGESNTETDGLEAMAA